ncbi:hypothetical protein Skr01_27410 [Sphaerisporangium krabiense]|uniref:DUF3710 domain-containing protein n=1 Tax=Sphaerisporangium krabiense TaxID=763782 RepID=A0A7W8ZAB4_9ACTN|nr:DUF3710 domain-containing protein [Sphaerisporangium krabiense]MBB5630389.1 hypothetical protein [Sphaerisporangium krabiense]GII62656.1 hypothetical protein Skr01_27410 [Sphaerisporangium krabiense]
MFRRRRRDETAETAPAAAEDATPEPARESGPWDSEESYPDIDRVDLGGMLLPVGPGFEVQLNVAGDQLVGAVVLVGESALQVHAFAAPKRSGIWDEVRAELAREVTGAGGSCEEREGPFGAELAAEVEQDGGLAPVRFIGVDGPRWFLRGVISGRAVTDAEIAGTLEDVVRDIVVVRGDQPMAPKEPIELRLPTEARQAVEQQASQQGRNGLNPFERGPEITETR